MKGLNLETFLRLAQADWGLWLAIAAVVSALGALFWTGLGSRKAIRRCIAFSIAAHIIVVVLGSGVGIVRSAIWPDLDREANEQLQRIRLEPIEADQDSAIESAASSGSDKARAARRRQMLADWDAPSQLTSLTDPATNRVLPRSGIQEGMSIERETPVDDPKLGASRAATLPDPANPPPAIPEPRKVASSSESETPDSKTTKEPAASSELNSLPIAKRPEAKSPTPVLDGPRFRPRPESLTSKSPESSPALSGPDVDIRRILRPEVGGASVSGTNTASKTSKADPEARSTVSDVSKSSRDLLPKLEERRRLAIKDVPEVYLMRLSPKRSEVAQQAGASPQSEQAVERALAWLTRHQDADGRWDGGTRKDADGRPLPGEDNFTIHAEPGEVVFGECAYWDADTALTGLALLSYLGAGYTHVDNSRYAGAVRKGLLFLFSQQKPDGDLRGESYVVGMYCHGIAALALSEAYALTGDPNLKGPVQRAIDFIVKAQAPKGLGWRYQPRSSMGDTSVLGWMVLAIKSAKVSGIEVPDSTREGALEWLNLVAAGDQKGLTRYQPGVPPTPSMTAEAWLSRQFLGVGGPGPASDEAAAYLLRYGPARGEFNVYYWYYGTLAMFQRGGQDWNAWNLQVRERLVAKQHKTGGEAGSWDPDDTVFGQRGGRIFSTTLATLSLEVYYRFLRLYEEPPGS